MRVYLAAPFVDYREAHRVRAVLADSGHSCTSSWIIQAIALGGREELDERTATTALAYNDADVAGSQALLLLARAGAGGECFAELRYAQTLELPCVVLGRAILSAWRPGTVRVATLEGALAALGNIASRL